MSPKSIKKNYIFNVAYQVLVILTPLITAPYLSRVLQPDGIGRASFAESIVSYFSLVAVMGISSYGQREISYVQNDISKRSEVFWNAKILGFCTAGITIVIYIIFSLLQKENSTLYLILTLNLVANFFDITWFFQGMEDFAKTVTRNAIVKIMQICYIFLFVKDKTDLPLYVLGLGLFTMLGNLSLWPYLPKYITKVKLSALKPFKDFKVVLSLFIPSVAIQIYTVLDKTMIGIITGSEYENGYYEQAMKISKMLLVLVTSLSTVMVPRIGHLFENNKKDEIQRYMYRGYRFVWFLGIPMCLGIIMTADNFVPWFFGAGYEKVIPLLKILSLLIPLIGINNVSGTQYLVPTKRQNLFTLTVSIGAITNFCLNLVLIYFFKSIGAAIASLAAETIIPIVQLILLRKEISPLHVIKEGVHYYIAGAVMVAVLIPISDSLSPSVLHTLIITAIGAAVYFTVLLIEKDDFFISNINSLFKNIKIRLK